MTRVLVRCANCGADQNLDATLITLTVNLATDQATVTFSCPLCGAGGETAPLIPDIQRVLLDAGCQLAAREV